MIAGLKPYTEYKESDLPWLKRVPAHWGLVPNRGLVRRRKVLVGERHTDLQLLSLTKQGVIVRDISTGKGKFSSDMGTSQEVRDGDLVFCLFDVPETPRTVGLSRHAGMITGAYTVFESLGSGNSEYFELFYRAMDDRKLLSPLYSGLRNTIPAARFLGTKSPLPPMPEQAAIVRFLAWANGRLEHAIRAKRRVIALLNEQKQAIIHRAVTCGLDPNVPLKPSGVPWLGDIPAHWEIRRAKYLFLEVDERSKEGKETHLAMSQRLGLVSSNQVESAMRSESYAGAKLCREGDLVLNRLKAHLGVFALAKQVGVISPDYTVFRKRVEISMQYYESVLRSSACRRELRIRAKGLVEGFWRLYTDDFYDIRLPVPPLDEQREIISAITAKTATLHVAIVRSEQEIILLQEYRARLVADVVTGKLDVREAAAKLPDEKPLDTTSDEDLGDDTNTLDQEASE
jgi:type I restriction enzyme S subunit